MKSDNNNNKILLLKKNLQFNEEKPYVVRQKTPAVRSPSSSQVNPFNKKSPSPTGGLSRKYSVMINQLFAIDSIQYFFLFHDSK